MKKMESMIVVGMQDLQTNSKNGFSQNTLHKIFLTFFLMTTLSDKYHLVAIDTYFL